ncbi:MAG: hypothetical protein ACRDG4_14210, partial [Chloroflexota bacterium]
ISYFATREGEAEQPDAFHIYATTEVATDYALSVYTEDATETIRVLNPNVCHLALRRPGGAVLLLGNSGAVTSIVSVELAGLLAPDLYYIVHLYDSENRQWGAGDRTRGADLSAPAVSIEAGGFRVVRFEEA